jgi:CBS domain-containing protein
MFHESHEFYVKLLRYPNAAKDEHGRLLVAAAVGVTSDTFERAEALLKAGADAIVIDTAHGHSAGVLRKIREIRETFSEATLIAGNIATARSNVSLVTPTAAATNKRPCSSFAALGNSITFSISLIVGLVTAPVGTKLQDAEKTLQKHKIEKLPIVDEDGRLSGLITIKDIEKVIEFPNAAKDEHGRLLVFLQCFFCIL